WYRNNGSFNRDPVTGNSGFEWPKGENKFARYASGLWIGAVVGNDTLIAMAEYDYEYLPGYIDNNGVPQGKDDPAYRVYTIKKVDSTSSDYLNWPVNQGAYTDLSGKPYLIGNQTMFYSYTDGYPESHGNNSGSTDPLKAQILQTNWCFVQSYGFLNDIIFTEYRIINRGSLPWTKCYIANWTDDDVGNGTDDGAGCDTILDLAYTYNSTNLDNQYGIAPPAVGFALIKGPLISSIGDTVRYYNPPGSNNLVIKPDCKAIGMSAFNFYCPGNPTCGDPSNFRETYLNLLGKRRDGTSWITPAGMITNFAFSGDPESNTGWLLGGGDDRRFLQCTGPVIVNPGDTQTIVISQIIARGSNNKNSVTKLKQSARIAQRFFDNNFDVAVNPPSQKVSAYAPGNGKIYLSWSDSAEKVTMQNILSGGVYKFQGYNIYQIRPNNISPLASDTVLIKTFDIQDGVKDIRDSIYLNDYEGVVYGIVQRGSDNGISRYLVIDRDSLAHREFINGTEYKFSVTAYYYDPLGGINTLPKVIKSAINENIIKVIPQNITPGTQISYEYGDTIYTDQRDLGVMPIVLRPFELMNATYTSTFGQRGIDTSWTLTKNVNGIISTLFENIKDFEGLQDTAKIVDGFLLVHQAIGDSGIIRDPENGILDFRGKNFYTRQRAWTYDPPQNLWIEGPDTTAVKTARVFTNKQFDSRSIGMSFPTLGTFKNNITRIKANGKFFQNVSTTSPILTGGPLRKIQIIFGQSSMSYRFSPIDSTLTNAPYADMISVPFSVYAVDELDSSGGAPRQLNTGFMDADRDGQWNPDTSKLGGYHFTYVFASNYSSAPDVNYTNKNPGLGSPATGFPSLDVMYAWLPRVKKNSNGTPMNFTNGDKLTVTPYIITRPDFVPGYPIKYSWTVQGTKVNNSSTNSAEIDKIKAFPNPYFSTSELEYDSGGEKFIYFSHLPLQCNIYVYTLDGILVKRIERNQSDPSNTLEKWDLRNSESKFVASGMYIIYVDCKGLGAKTLKIAVFTAR
ncbi:MAG: hypothetical protein ABIY50_02970, partial [Ignavibacteria bacterium]